MLERKPVVKQAVVTTLGACPAAPPRSRYGYGSVVWFTSLVFVLFQFFIQLSSAEIVNGLMKSFALSAFGAGMLASAYYYIYVLLQTPSGMLVDRYGPRRLLTAGALGLSLGCFMFAYPHSVWVAAIGRLLMGTSAACAFVGSLTLVRRWFPTKHFTLFAGIAEFFGMFGAIIGSLFLAHLIGKYGWRHSIFGAAAISLVLALVLWTVIRDHPEGRVYQGTRSVGKTMKRDLAFLFRNKIAWINGAYSGLMFAVITVFVALWAVNFFEVSHHLNLLRATFLADLVFVGVAVGSLFIGWLDTQVKCRRIVLVGAAVCATVLMSLIIAFPIMPISLTSVLMVMLGMCCSAYVINFAVASEIVPSCMQGTSIGLANALSVGTAPILQPLVGLVLTKMALLHHVVNPVNYLVRDYQWALVLIPLGTLIAAVLAFYIPERRRTH